jgi:hypothetical protein
VERPHAERSTHGGASVSLIGMWPRHLVLGWIRAALVTIAVGGAGCEDPQVRYQIALSGELPASVTPRLQLGDQTLPVKRVGSDRWLTRYVAKRSKDRLSRRLDQLKVALPSPCGAIVSPFRPANPGFDGEGGLAAFRSRLRDEEALTAPRGQTTELRMALGVLKLPPPLTLTIDWRGAPRDAQLRLGKLLLRRGQGIPTPRTLARPWARPAGLAKGDAELFRVFAPTCDAGREVLVGRRAVGRLPSKLGERGVAVIDVTGRHCYRSLGSAQGASSRPASRPGPTTRPGPASRSVSHVHALRGGPAPDVIETPFPQCPKLVAGGRSCRTLRPCPASPPAPAQAPRSRPGG